MPLSIDITLVGEAEGDAYAQMGAEFHLAIRCVIVRKHVRDAMMV